VALEIVGVADESHGAALGHMLVDHGGSQIRLARKLLAQLIVRPLEEMGGG